jgi:GntR family transcriptional regulator / MocR family aminotransferase
VLVDDLPIVLDRRRPEPLAVQVADALRAAASGGALRAGDRLTSTRALAARLGVSRTVTAAAYDQLLAEGWLVGRRGSGTFVTAVPPMGRRAAAVGPHDPRPRAIPTTTAPAEITATATATDCPAGTGSMHARPIDLTSGRPCLAALDRAVWRRAWRVASHRSPAVEPDYAGRIEFRQAVVDQLLRHRGLPAHPEQVLATAGTTAALDEIAALLPAGATVAFEEPGYRRAAETLAARRIRVLPVPVDEDGLRVDRLPVGLAAVYCTPAHQFPLGPRLSAARRVELVERARADGFLVFEDDYDGELRYDVAPLPLLAALGPDVVVHLGTASKLLTPTLGVGWLVAPPALHARVLAARDRAGMRPSPAGQLVFEALADYGDLARHLRRLRAELTERRAWVAGALAGTGAALHGDAAGAHLWLALPSAAAECSVVAGAAEAGVLVQGLREHHRGAAAVFGVSLGYAGPSRVDLERGVAVVADLVRRSRP